MTAHTDTLYAYFGYRDASAALRWLERAFGFTTTLEIPDAAGGIMHAELRRGGVAIMVFTDEAGYDRPVRRGESVGHGMYVAVADAAAVDAVHAGAIAEGATGIWPPSANDWGSYRCRVLDPEGFEWTFGTHVPAGDDQGESPG